jgi:hypothetical protein
MITTTIWGDDPAPPSFKQRRDGDGPADPKKAEPVLTVTFDVGKKAAKRKPSSKQRPKKK